MQANVRGFDAFIVQPSSNVNSRGFEPIGSDIPAGKVFHEPANRRYIMFRPPEFQVGV
jgi:hypothetical protein